MEIQRVLFEVWYRGEYPLEDMTRGPDGSYQFQDVETAWIVWCASVSVNQVDVKLGGDFVQPHWGHLGQAFIDGAREARMNPEADDDLFVRAADGYTKRLFEELDPVSEELLRTNHWISDGIRGKEL